MFALLIADKLQAVSCGHGDFRRQTRTQCADGRPTTKPCPPFYTLCRRHWLRPLVLVACRFRAEEEGPSGRVFRHRVERQFPRDAQITWKTSWTYGRCFDNQFLSRWELPLFCILLSCADYRVVANVFRVHKLTVKKFVSCWCRGAASSVTHQLIKAAKRGRSLCHWLSQMILLQACVEHAHPIPIALSGRPHHTVRIHFGCPVAVGRSK